LRSKRLKNCQKKKKLEVKKTPKLSEKEEPLKKNKDNANK